jgi:hypothetical protein
VRLSRLSTARFESRTRKIRRLRRRAWTSQRPIVTRAADVPIKHEYIPGEYDACAPSGAQRALGLASDITLLIFLSPFFAVWFLYRAVVHLLRQRR